MLDKIFLFFSLVEVRFVLAILTVATVLDILKRMLSGTRLFRRRYKDIEIDSVLSIYHENMQSGRYANGVKQFRKAGHLPNGYKEV